MKRGSHIENDMDNDDKHWLRRLSHYQRALALLTKFIANGEFNKLEQLGLIHAFEFTHELAWNVMKDYFEYQGNNAIAGPRDATREAFQKNLIGDGEAWMGMIKSRDQSSHTYNQETADEISGLVVSSYFSLFKTFDEKMTALSHAAGN